MSNMMRAREGDGRTRHLVERVPIPTGQRFGIRQALPEIRL